MLTFGAWVLGECCPNLVLAFVTWALLGQPQQYKKSHRIPPKIDQKSSTVGTWDGSGHHWAPPGGILGITWGPDAKTHQKSDLVDPPGVPKEVIFEHFSILFRVLFLVTSCCIVFKYLLEPLGPEKVVIFIGGSFKNAFRDFAKKSQNWFQNYPNMEPKWSLKSEKSASGGNSKTGSKKVAKKCENESQKGRGVNYNFDVLGSLEGVLVPLGASRHPQSLDFTLWVDSLAFFLQFELNF